MLEEVQRRQAEREAERQKLAREEESHFRTYRDRGTAQTHRRARAKSLADKPQPDATKSRTIRTSKPAADATRTVQVPQSGIACRRPEGGPSPQPVQTVQTTQQFIPESAQAPRLCRKRSPNPLCLRPRPPRSAAAGRDAPPTPRPKPL